MEREARGSDEASFQDDEEGEEGQEGDDSREWTYEQLLEIGRLGGGKKGRGGT